MNAFIGQEHCAHHHAHTLTYVFTRSRTHIMTSGVTSKNNDLKAIPTPAFNTGSLSFRVLSWLYFGGSLKQTGWRQRVEGLDVRQPALPQWLAAGTIGRKVQAVSFLLLLLGGLLGVSTMVGALSYSGDTPVNLWLMLGLFCILPFVLTLSSTITALRLSARHPPFLLELFARATQKIARGVNAQELLMSAAGRLWLFRQLQWLGVIFQIALIASFMLVLLFNDIAFGWSSTLITEAQWLPTFLSIFTGPWQWLVDGPSELLISQSQFYRASSVMAMVENPALRGHWWPHIVMAMIVYGLIPRCLLVFWLSYKTKMVLLNEVACSSMLDQFYQASNNRATLKPKMPPEIHSAAVVDQALLAELILTNEWVISWQRDFSSAPCAVLGLKKWQDDERWLQDNAASLGRVTYFLVQEQQVPTAELADLFAIVDELNPQAIIQLIVLVTIGHEKDAERLTHQRESWRYFAAEHAKAILFVQDLKRQEGNCTGDTQQVNTDEK